MLNLTNSSIKRWITFRFVSKFHMKMYKSLQISLFYSAPVTSDENKLISLNIINVWTNMWNIPPANAFYILVNIFIYLHPRWQIIKSSRLITHGDVTPHFQYETNVWSHEFHRSIRSVSHLHWIPKLGLLECDGATLRVLKWTLNKLSDSP